MVSVFGNEIKSLSSIQPNLNFWNQLHLKIPFYAVFCHKQPPDDQIIQFWRQVSMQLWKKWPTRFYWDQGLNFHWIGPWANSFYYLPCPWFCLFVCLFVLLQITHFPVSWRLMVKKRITNIGLRSQNVVSSHFNDFLVFGEPVYCRADLHYAVGLNCRAEQFSPALHCTPLQILWTPLKKI